jgi:mono/diheme cytochrome c family protein
MLRKNIFAAITLITGGVLLMTSCGNDKTSTGWEYMPDMYRGPAVEAYQAHNFFSDSLGSRKPVEGTIARGFMSYEKYPNTNEGYELAKANMKVPASIPADSLNLADAAKLYGIFCTHCHGEKGDGNGILMKREKFLGIPSYAAREITEGSVFHVITYGKNLMGPHAAQLTPEERWKVTQYVMKLRADLIGGDEKEEDTTEEAEASTEGEDQEVNNTQS